MIWERKKKGKKERKKSHRHTEAPMTTLSVLYKRSRQDKSNDTKKTMKGNHIGPHEPPKGEEDSLDFEQLVWST